MMTKKLEQLQMDLDFLMFGIKMMNGFELRFQKEIFLLYQLEYIIDSFLQNQILSRFGFIRLKSYASQKYIKLPTLYGTNLNSRQFDYSLVTPFGLQSTETVTKKKFLKVKFVKNILLQ